MEAYAAAGASSNPSPLGAGLFIACGLAYVTRRRRIGGWLLYFYVQLYSSALMQLVFLPRALADFRPSHWDDASLYVWYIVSASAQILAQLAVVVLATTLLARRTQLNVQRTTWATGAQAGAASLALALNLSVFHDTVAATLSGLVLVFSSIWCAYFLRSLRVRRVFIEQNWDTSAPRPLTLTSRELRYLRRRAVVAGGGTFIVVLVLMGMALSGQPPDAHLFVVAGISAVFAGLAGRYLELRPRKRVALARLDEATHQPVHSGPSAGVSR
jgi:hypothetical protein